MLGWKRIDDDLPFSTRLRFWIYENFTYITIAVTVLSFVAVLLAWSAVNTAKKSSEKLYEITRYALTYVIVASPDGRVYSVERKPFEGFVLANYTATVLENLIMSLSDLTLGFRDTSLSSWDKSVKAKKLLPYLSEKGEQDLRTLVEGYYFRLVEENAFPLNVNVVGFKVLEVEEIDVDRFLVSIDYEATGTFRVEGGRTVIRSGSVEVEAEIFFDPEKAGKEGLNLVGLQVDSLKIKYGLKP